MTNFPKVGRMVKKISPFVDISKEMLAEALDFPGRNDEWLEVGNIRQVVWCKLWGVVLPSEWDKIEIPNPLRVFVQSNNNKSHPQSGSATRCKVLSVGKGRNYGKLAFSNKCPVCFCESCVSGNSAGGASAGQSIPAEDRVLVPESSEPRE